MTLGDLEARMTLAELRYWAALIGIEARERELERAKTKARHH